jgi:hypothetical protein
MKPRRIQLKRAKGWRKPIGVVVVSRPSKYGNPFRVGRHLTTPEAAVVAYREQLVTRGLWRGATLLVNVHDVRRELRGRDLACWCPIGQPCHADVLLEVANS